MLQDNVERYRKEIASLREKGQMMSAATQKHEQTIHTLNEDVRAAKEKLNMAEVCPRSSNLYLFYGDVCTQVFFLKHFIIIMWGIAVVLDLNLGLLKE